MADEEQPLYLYGFTQFHLGQRLTQSMKVGFVWPSSFWSQNL